MFDRLLLLSLGSVVYHGPAANALDYCAHFGCSCSKEWNPCDFLLDLVSPTKALQRKEICDTTTTEQVPDVEQLINQWTYSDEARHIQLEMRENLKAFEKPKSSTRHKKSARRAGANWCHEVRTLWRRTTLNSLRNPMSAIVILLIQAMQGLVLGGIFLQQSTAWAGPKPQPAISDATWQDPWVKAYTEGLLDRPYPRPFVTMIEHGVDGLGSYIFLNDTSPPGTLEGVAVSLVDDYSTCLYRALDLPNNGYYNLTDLLTTDAATTWDDWEPRRIYQNMLAYLQIFDYKYLDGDGHYPMSLDFMPKCLKKATSGLNFYECLMRESKPHIDPFLKCAGLPPLPSFETSAETTTPEPDEPSQWTVSRRRKPKKHKKPRQNRSQVSGSVVIGKGSEGVYDMVQDILGPDLMQFVDAAGKWAHRSTSCPSKVCQVARRVYDFLVEWADGTTQTILTALNLSGCLFFVSTILGFASYDALLTFPQERALFNRESANGLYRPSSYYVAKNIADLPFQLIPSLLMATIYYFMVGFDVTATQFFTYFAICILTSFCAYGFGYMVSAAAPRMEIALLTAPLTLVIWLVLAGFFLRDGDIPRWIEWFKYLSFYRWSFFSFVINQFPPGHYFGTLSNTFILGLSGVTEKNLTLTAWVLTALGVVYRLLGFIFLATTNRRVGLEA